jgi:hypothetical protein
MPKNPPSAQKTPDQIPYAQRAQLQGKEYEMDPLAATQGLDILSHGAKQNPQRFTLGQRMMEPPAAVGRRIKRALSNLKQRQFLEGKIKHDPRKGRTQGEEVTKALSDKAHGDLLGGRSDDVVKYLAKKRVELALKSGDK